MAALRAFVDSTQDVIRGTVKLKLYKGCIMDAGASSECSLYDDSLASFATGPLYDHKDASGFIRLLALPTKARGSMKNRKAALAGAAAAGAPAPSAGGIAACPAP